MPARKPKDSERLTKVYIEQAIDILNNKGTKKKACEVLGIAYNTTRLDSIISKYLENKKRESERREEKRGTPPTKQEINYVVSTYLEGGTLESIANALYRPISFVSNILNKYSVPMRAQAYSYFNPRLLPEESIREKFSLGEKVYSARYDSLAQIEKEFKPGIYRIYLLSEKWRQYAYQPYWELGSLEHLRKIGIDV